MKFTKMTLHLMMEAIIEEYFTDGNTLGLWEVIEYVKGIYQEEINTLE